MIRSFDLPHLTYSLTDLARIWNKQLPLKQTIRINGTNEITERLREPYKLKDLLMLFPALYEEQYHTVDTEYADAMRGRIFVFGTRITQEEHRAKR